ncbi:MAG: hypothetical protein GY799_02640 [Desulfobulbaceae bacterium]|nr:hypothetical protein [Desulfobulbaceae bacterium]
MARSYPANQHMGIIYPRFYQYKKRSSDRDWILSRMSVFPRDEQQEIATKYERLYLGGGRQAANTWLNELFKEVRDAKASN